jgi:hypothetical protein
MHRRQPISCRSFGSRTVDCLPPLSIAVSSESLICEIERAPGPARLTVTAVITGGSHADLSHVSFHVDRGFTRSPVDPSRQLMALQDLLRHLDRTWRQSAEARSATPHQSWCSQTTKNRSALTTLNTTFTPRGAAPSDNSPSSSRVRKCSCRRRQRRRDARFVELPFHGLASGRMLITPCGFA